MTLQHLIRRSLRHHLRTHLGVILGAAIGVAIITGALIVGDSVRQSLRQTALEKLGRTTHVLVTGDRLFLSDLGTRLQARLSAPSERHSTGLILPGTVARQDGSARANHITMLGVDPQTWPEFADWGTNGLGAGPLHSWLNGEVVFINEALARQLNAREHDEVVLRVRKITSLSQDAVIAPQEDSTVALRMRIGPILRGDQLGNFSLVASGSANFNAFLPLEVLNRRVDAANRANLLLWKAASGEGTDKLNGRLGECWVPEDGGLLVRTTPSGAVEVSSSRIFLEGAAVRAASVPGGVRIFTYLANLLEANGRATPYSMVTATESPYVPPDMKDDEILVNQWLAEDLQVKLGDEIRLSYYLADSGSRLAQQTNRFRVKAIVPMTGRYADRTLMPEFPGLAKAERTQDWDAGFPLTYTIRPKDEAYWKANRGTPKAFVTSKAGETMWTNRFGELTAVRLPLPAVMSEAAFVQVVRSNLLSQLRPSDLGLKFEGIRQRALTGANQAQDFGQLFLGFSLFLVTASLLLLGLIFRLGLEQRIEEIGILMAVGFTGRRVTFFLLFEGLLLTSVGGALGLAGGIAYAKTMLLGLSTIWRDATAGSVLSFHMTPMSLAVGLISGIVVSLGVVYLSAARLAKRQARELLAGQFAGQNRSGRPFAKWFGVGCLLGASGIIVWAIASEQANNAGAFFGAGALVLGGGIGIASQWLQSLVKPASNSWGRVATHLGMLGAKASARRRSRSVTVIGLLACGTFLVAAIGVFRLDANRDANRLDSGTGGFALLGESALPLVQDLNTATGLEANGLDPLEMQGTEVVAFRMREGDEASCLNLSRAQRPRLLGVDPARLKGRFTFASVAPGLNRDHGWDLLSGPHAPDEVLAIGDANSIQWAMGKRPGESLEYVDETGRPFRVRIVAGVANSILQGVLVVNEKNFVSRFPSQSGYRWFLIASPPDRTATVASRLSRSLQDLGLELTRTTDRLNQFNAVQNTYLGTFQLLGGLGLILGSAGLGLILFRNVLERRSELALLSAMGFRRRQVRHLLLSEHVMLLGTGLAIGVLAAAVAVLPSLLQPGAQLPVRSIAITLAGVLINGLLWVNIAARAALRGNLLAALRNE